VAAAICFFGLPVTAAILPALPMVSGAGVQARRPLPDFTSFNPG
jgi:hypothetical protein